MNGTQVKTQQWHGRLIWIAAMTLTRHQQSGSFIIMYLIGSHKKYKNNRLLMQGIFVKVHARLIPDAAPGHIFLPITL